MIYDRGTYVRCSDCGLRCDANDDGWSYGVDNCQGEVVLCAGCIARMEDDRYTRAAAMDKS